MNSRTKEAFDKLANQIAILAMGCVHMTGVETVQDVQKAVEQLKYALKHDETITEIR